MVGHRNYLDFNATAPIRPGAAHAMTQALQEAATTGANPSSVHADGRGARKRVEDARAAVAGLAGCKPQELVFLSGGTEANNWVLARAEADALIVSQIEHDSVLAPAMARGGVPVRTIAPTPDGVITVSAVEEALAEARAAGATRPLVSVMLANNEIGTIQPVSEIAQAVHAAGGLMHCDAIQALGKIDLSFADIGADFMTLSAHKIGGSPGVGALILREGVGLPTLIAGGGQEMRRRSGTENVPGIVGFGAAAQEAQAGLEAFQELAPLRDRFEARIAEIAPEARFFGQRAARLPNTGAFAVPGLAAETQMMHMDLAGFSIGSGSACSSGKVTPSHVLSALGETSETSQSALRISLGWTTTPEAVDAAAEAWARLYHRHCNDNGRAA